MISVEIYKKGMLLFRAFQCFVLLVVLGSHFCGSEYVKLEIYRYPECTDARPSSVWLFPLPSLCMKYPFEQRVVFSYNSTLKKLKRAMYDDDSCSPDKENENKTTFIDLSNCTGISAYSNTWYVNFTKLDSLPFNRSESLDWVILRNYLDTKCTVLFDSILSTNSNEMSVMALQTGDSGKSGNMKLFCQKDELIFEYYDGSEILGWKYLPDLPDDQCFERWNDTYYTGSFMKSIEKKCYSEAEFQTNFVSTIPKHSSAPYAITSYFFDESCSDNFTAYVQKLDSCVHTFTRTIVDGKIYEIHYSAAGCIGDILRVDIGIDTTDKKLMYDCYYAYVKDLQKLRWYKMLTFETDPYYPKMMSIISTYDTDCGGDIGHLKRDVDRPVSYITSEYCMDSRMLLVRDEVNMKSIRGYCEKGVLRAFNYTQTSVCYGYFSEVSGGDLCFESVNPGYYHHMTCIPRYCGDISEYDKSVCNARGNCVENGVCDCDGGFIGDLCDSWGCEGIDKDDDEVCSGHGKCTDVDKCDCSFGYSGEFCTGAAYIAVIVVPVVSVVVSLWLILTFCCCFLVICNACCCCILCLCFGLAYQNSRIGKFKKLKNFDLLLKEQLIDEDQSVAHLSINKELFRVNYDEIELVSVLGEGGSNSVVYRVMWHAKDAAFKCFKTRTVCSSLESFSEFENELSIISSIHHPHILQVGLVNFSNDYLLPHILQFFGACLNPPRVGIVMEYCGNGDLVGFLKRFSMDNDDDMYPVSEKMRMVREITSAMEYLSERNVMHRDLKCENVLVDSIHSCKLTDFGLSKVVDRMTQPKTKYLGTSYFIAPEVILAGAYDLRCDVFSFSMVLYTLITENYFPFEGYSVHNIELSIANDKDLRPDIVPFKKLVGKEYSWIVDIMIKCWDHDPKIRLSFKRISQILASKLGTRLI